MIYNYYTERKKEKREKEENKLVTDIGQPLRM